MTFLVIVLYAIDCAVIGGGVVAAYHFVVGHPVEQYELWMGAIVGLLVGFILEEVVGRIRWR